MLEPGMNAMIDPAKEKAGADSQTIFELLDVEKVYEVTKSEGFLKRSKRKLAALDGVRLRIDQGASMALVGESGSGKSTLLRVLLGLTEPTQGLALIAVVRSTRCAKQGRTSPATWRWSTRTRAARSIRA